MKTSVHRALLLLDQRRFDLAEMECRRALGEDPDDGIGHAILAITLAELDRRPAALDAARRAVSLEPDEPFCHFVAAQVLDRMDKPAEAEIAIHEAIRLDSAEADYHALLANLHFQRGRWRESLRVAEDGLALQPDHVSCTNTRAMALVKLGRPIEADQAITAALAREPENALTHANRGWTLLESGRHREAMEHFREALRLEPGMEWARQGILHALKARRLVYRWLLKYFLLMSRLNRGGRLAVILGGWLGYQALRVAARYAPSLQAVLIPLVVVYILFCLLTWTAQPLFNLILRLDRFGRLALSREETRQTNAVAACLCLALAGLGIIPIYGLVAGLGAAAIFLALILPVSITFGCPPGWPTWVMALYTVVLIVLGPGSLIALAVLSGVSEPVSPEKWDFFANGLATYAMGVVCSMFVGLLLSALGGRRR